MMPQLYILIKWPGRYEELIKIKNASLGSKVNWEEKYNELNNK